MVVTSKTPRKERAILVKELRKGKVKILLNVGIYTVGFDYPELDCIVLLRPTRSLRLHSQILGRVGRIAEGKRVHAGIRALVVPGSVEVKALAEKEALDKIFTDAGFEWRDAGCSMCLAMNPDKLEGNEICASTSNRNFIGRQGSPTGRTLLMSPAMVVAAAVNGKVVDVRQAR